MTDFDFNATYEQAAKEFNLGKGQYLKAKEGANKMRLVSICLPHESQFKGQTRFQWLCQVIDRTDNKVKPYFMPVVVYNGIKDLQLSEDFAFREIPMPYDIIVNATGAGTKEVKYTVLPSKEKPLTEDELQAIKDAPTVQELQKKIRENEKVENVPTENKEQPLTEEEIENIPF